MARDLPAAGAEVPCFLCTSPETVEEAAEALAATANVAPRGYVDTKAMLAREDLSLLQALVPGEEAAVEAPASSTRDPAADSLIIRFRYRTESHACDAQVRLQSSDETPRRAAYALDGRWARRVVTTPGYQLSFPSSDQTVPIADPLTRLVAEFVAALADTSRGAAPPHTRRIHQRMQLLVALATAYAPEEIPQS